MKKNLQKWNAQVRKRNGKGNYDKWYYEIYTIYTIEYIIYNEIWISRKAIS